MRRNEWTEMTLGEIARPDYGLVDGPFGSNLPATEYVSEGVPVIRGSNLSVGGRRFIDTDFVFVSEKTAGRLIRSTCGPLDIVFTKKGTLGQAGLIPERHKYPMFLLSSNQMKLSVNPTLADPNFVYYFISSPVSRNKIIRDSEATGVPKINLEYLRKFPISLPSLREQQRIGELLSLLDAKIELNQRTSENLENIARSIFRSWFVDFEPVRAKAIGKKRVAGGLADPDRFPSTFCNTALGELPVGWIEGTMGQICERIIDKVIVPEEWHSKKLIDLRRMPQRSIALIDWGLGKEISSSVTCFEARDTLFGAIRPYFHKVGIAPIDGVTNISVFVLRPKERAEWPYLTLLASMPETVQYASQLAKGTKMPVVAWGDLRQMPTVIPPVAVRNAFSSLNEPLLDRIIVAIKNSSTLASIKDIVLPGLVDGKLRINEAESLVEAHA